MRSTSCWLDCLPEQKQEKRLPKLESRRRGSSQRECAVARPESSPSPTLVFYGRLPDTTRIGWEQSKSSKPLSILPKMTGKTVFEWDGPHLVVKERFEVTADTGAGGNY